jgi:hypothetical protein
MLFLSNFMQKDTNLFFLLMENDIASIQYNRIGR